MRISRFRVSYLLLFVAIAIWFTLVTQLVVLRHNSYRTFDFDLGIHDQSIWLLAHGKWFNTVCGLNVFGHHAMFMYYLLVPFSWLGAGPNTWNLLQVLALSISSVPIFLIARNRIQDDYKACVFGIAWLILPSTAYLAFETFHPETMAIPFLLMAYHKCTSLPELNNWSMDRHKIIALAWTVSAMLWKEDMALAIMGIGILMLFKKNWRFGSLILFVSLTYFVVIALWLVPHLAGSQTAYGMLYGDLGTTPSDVFKTSISQPSLFASRLNSNNAIGYLGQLTSPLSFLSFFAPLTLLIGLPQFFINILTVSDFTWSRMYHYQAIPSVAAISASIEGFSFIVRKSRVLSQLAIVALVFTVGWSSYSWGMLPYSSQGISPRKFSEFKVDGWNATLERIGPTEGVTAQYNFVPHVSQREIIYTFPNPWIMSNFLNDETKYADVCRINWIVVHVATLDQAQVNILDSLVAKKLYGDIQELDGITSLRYIGPPCEIK